MAEFHCLHCGSKNIETVMDEAIARWIRCLDCEKESVLGIDGGLTRIEIKL